MKLESVNWFKVGKYLAVVMSPEEIIAEGLVNVIPKRRGVRSTIPYIIWGKRKTLTVSYGVYTAMSSHTYKVADDTYQQMAGGSIGLELTGAVSRPFMLRWDHLYKANVSKAGMNLQMYERYVDDSNQVALVPPPGTKYDNTTKSGWSLIISAKS